MKKIVAYDFGQCRVCHTRVTMDTAHMRWHRSKNGIGAVSLHDFGVVCVACLASEPPSRTGVLGNDGDALAKFVGALGVERIHVLVRGVNQTDGTALRALSRAYETRDVGYMGQPPAPDQKFLTTRDMPSRKKYEAKFARWRAEYEATAMPEERLRANEGDRIAKKRALAPSFRFAGVRIKS